MTTSPKASDLLGQLRALGEAARPHYTAAELDSGFARLVAVARERSKDPEALRESEISLLSAQLGLNAHALANRLVEAGDLAAAEQWLRIAVQYGAGAQHDLDEVVTQRRTSGFLERMRAAAGTTPAGLTTEAWLEMVGEAVVAVAEADGEPNDGTPEIYGVAALRAAIPTAVAAIRAVVAEEIAAAITAAGDRAGSGAKAHYLRKAAELARQIGTSSHDQS